MNMLQELYEDLKNINVKIPRKRKKRMDDQIQQEQPQETPVESTEPIVEPVAAEEEAPIERENEDRTTFNCPDCRGEGLKDQSTLCPRCKGIGKL